MIILLIVGIILFYMMCALLNFGMLYANMPSHDALSPREHLGMILLFSLAIGLSGPLGLFWVFCMTGFAEEGLKFRNV